LVDADLLFPAGAAGWSYAARLWVTGPVAAALSVAAQRVRRGEVPCATGTDDDRASPLAAHGPREVGGLAEWQATVGDLPLQVPRKIQQREPVGNPLRGMGERGGDLCAGKAEVEEGLACSGFLDRRHRCAMQVLDHRRNELIVGEPFGHNQRRDVGEAGLACGGNTPLAEAQAETTVMGSFGQHGLENTMLLDRLRELGQVSEVASGVVRVAPQLLDRNSEHCSDPGESVSGMGDRSCLWHTFSLLYTCIATHEYSETGSG
jgi:hypothetical protein